MEPTEQVGICGRDWRHAGPGERKWDHWLHATHFPRRLSDSPGRGAIILACGWGRPDADALPATARLCRSSSPMDREWARGYSAHSGVWEAVYGQHADDDDDYPGVAPAACVVWCPSTTRRESSRRSGLALDWVRHVFADADVLSLPHSSGGDCEEYADAVAALYDAGAVIVGDVGWREYLPGRVVLDVPAAHVIRDGKPSPTGTRTDLPGVAYWSVVVPYDDGPSGGPVASAMLAGLWASNIAALPPGLRKERWQRDRGADLMASPDPAEPHLHGYHWPTDAPPRPWVRGAESLLTVDSSSESRAVPHPTPLLTGPDAPTNPNHSMTRNGRAKRN